MREIKKYSINEGMELLYDALDLLIEKLKTWLNELILILPNLLIAIIVFLIIVQISKAVKHFVEKGIHKVSRNKVISGLLSGMIQFIVIMIGGFFALEILQLSKVVTSLLAGAGILGLALGIAFQDFIGNIISGIYLAIKKPLHVGDFVETNDHYGKVTHMDLRNTVIETTSGQVVFIPNKVVFDTPLVNFSKKKVRRVNLSIGVSYSDDLEKAQSVALEAVKSLDVCLKDKETTLVYDEFGDSSINFTIRFWVKFNRQFDYRSARSEAVMAIKKAFDTEGITIPFPIRTLDMDPKLIKSLKK